jgi:hypothetical protein
MRASIIIIRRRCQPEIEKSYGMREIDARKEGKASKSRSRGQGKMVGGGTQETVFRKAHGRKEKG